MKAISLWQPWATLVAIGAKRIETRSWSTGYRGPIAIHAAQKITPEFGRICHSKPFSSVLFAAGYDEMECFEFGKIIALANLADVSTTEHICNAGEEFEQESIVKAYRTRRNERSFGDYSNGRFGWLIDNAKKFPEAIPFRGRQRIFNWPAQYCDGCDGTGLMEGWNRRDGWPCPKCKGMAVIAA